MTRNPHTISPSRELEEITVPEQAPTGLEYKTLALAEVPLRLQVKSVALDEPAGPGTNGAVNAPYEYVDDQGNHIGVAESFVAVTGVIDKVDDVIPPGAFKRTLGELEPKACLGHDWNRPIGYPESIEEWLPGDPRLPEFKVDGTPWPEHAGVLRAVTRYNLDTEDGRRAYSDAKFFGPQRTAWSIGYVPHATKTRHAVDPHSGRYARILHDLDLYEYSQVLHGAHPMALSQSIKSGQPDGIEIKLRYVQDAGYWGYPKGTPIRPGMRPRGTTARRLREQGRTPSANQGVTTEAPKPDGTMRGSRAKPDQVAERTDAEGLFPEPDSEDRVRAEGAQGNDEQYVADLAQNEAGDLEGEQDDNRDKAFRGLLKEGITPDELRADLTNVADNEKNTSGYTLEPDEVDDLVEDYTARYNALAKRQSRQRRGESAPEEAAAAAEQGTGDEPPDAQSGASEVVPDGDGEPASPVVSLDRLAQMSKAQAVAAVADLDDDTLAAYDSELTARASALGKPGQRSNAHQAVADEIAKREQSGGPAAEQAPPVDGEADTASTPEQQVIAALDSLVKPGDWARITNLRAALPDMDEAELTATLKRMGKDGGLTLAPNPNGRAITQADRDAAVMIGGDQNHLVLRDPDEEAPEGAPEATEQGADSVDGEEIPGQEPSTQDDLADAEGDFPQDAGAAGAPDVPGPDQIPARAPLNAEGDHYDEQGNLISGGGAFEAAQNQALDAINDGDEIALADALDQLRKGHLIELTMADGTRVRGSESTASLAAELVDMDRAKARTCIREWAEGGIDRHQRQTESDFVAQVDAYRTLDDQELTGEAERLEAERVNLSDQGLDTYDSAMWENGVHLRALDAVRAERAGGAPVDTGAPSPERTAVIAADEVADAEEIADAAHGLTESDDGEFEVDDDVAARQERVAGMLAQAEAGAVDFTARAPEQLRADRADVVAELRMQAHMDSRRRRRERGQPPASVEPDAGAAEETPEVQAEPKPSVRPGVAGAAEDFADALESGDTEAINRTRARLASSLRRSRSDTEPIKALRALMDANDDPTPAQLRAAAEAIRVDTRARRNQAARGRRTARRFERERLRSLLGQIESAMVSKGMDFDKVPEDAADYNPDNLGPDAVGSLPGGAGNAAGTWVQKVETIQWSGERRTTSEVEGSHYRASVYAPDNRPASYEWEVTGADGTTIRADGVAPDMASAQAAVEIALETQGRLGNLPPDAQLPSALIPSDSSARPLSEVEADLDKVRERLAMPSRLVNPVTGGQDPLNPETVATKPPTTRAFDEPERVRRHLEARAATLDSGARSSLDTLINAVRWDDVQLTPGGRFMVIQRSGQKGYELFTTTHGLRVPVGNSGAGGITLGKSDLLRAGELYESLRADNGAVVDWTAPDRDVLPLIKELSFGRHGDGLAGLNNAVVAAIAQDKLRAGKWNDKVLREAASRWFSSGRGNITNWTRESQARHAQRMLKAQIGGGFNGRVHPEDRKTLGVADGAELLSSLGAPDAAAVLLRRRAAELREGFGQADADNAHGATLLDTLAASYLGMHSPVRAPGERALMLRTGERVTLSAQADDGIGGPDPELPDLRTFRALTPMRKEGAYGGSSALVVDESTGEQFEVHIAGTIGGGQRLAIHRRGVNHPERSVDLGSSTFVVTGPQEPVPGSQEELTGLAGADVAVFGQNVLDAAANSLPETLAERSARQRSAPAGGRAPRRTSSRAPRRTAAPAPPAAVVGQQHLAAAQTDQRRALLGMEFSLAEEASPGGFATLEDAVAWAAVRAGSFPESEKAATGTEAYMLNFMAQGEQFTKGGGARLSPGGHFIITKNHFVIHIRTGGAVWGMTTQREGFTDASADSAMMVADYLERGRWDGKSIDWTKGKSGIQAQVKNAMESSTLTLDDKKVASPSTVAARAAITDMLGAAKTPKVADLGTLRYFATTTGGTSIAPNPDRYDLFGTRMKASRYAALGGAKVQGADMLPANTKAGEKLAKRTRVELDVAESLASLAPLDAVRRLNQVADSIGEETVTDIAGRTSTPAADLRALATRITDMWDRDKPSPLGRLLANDSQGVLTVSDSVSVEHSPIYGTNSETSRVAQSVADQVTKQLDDAGRQVTLRRDPDDPEGKLIASFGDITITPRPGSDDLINIDLDGSITLKWRAPHVGRMSLRLPRGSWDTGGKLDDDQYAEHARRVEKVLGEQMAEGNSTDVRFTVGGDGQSWTVERAEAHRRVMDALWKAAETVPRDRRAVIAGGLGGAGKSTVLRRFANISDGDYFTINPDDVKEEMARQGMIPDVPGLSPMEASALVHEESSHLANMMARRAYREGINVMWDITMSKRSSVEKRINELRENEYQEIDAVFVDIPVETSVERALARHRRGLEKFRTGKGSGGRYVPPALIRANASQAASSANRETFDQLQDQFDSWVVYDNSVAGRDPERVDGVGRWAE